MDSEQMSDNKSDAPGGFQATYSSIFRTRGAIILLGLVVAGLLFVLTAYKLDWSKVLLAFKTAVWLPWLPLAVLTYMFGMLARGVRLKILVQPEAKLTILTASNIVAVGYATNNILPARLGEFARAAMLGERTGMPYLLALTITFLERLLDGIVILFFFVVSSLLIPTDEWMRQAASICAILFACAMFVVGFITLSPQSAIGLTSNLTAWMGQKWHDRFIAFVSQVNNGFKCLRDARSALLVLFSSALVWLIESAFFMFIMPCFGLSPNLLKAIATMSFTNLGILVPSTPGYVGVYHAACQTALMAVSLGTGHRLDPNTAISYAVIVHFVFFVTVTIWGIIAMARYSFELGSAQALAWEAKSIEIKNLPESSNLPFSPRVITTYPAVTEEIKSGMSPFWIELCQCFIPEDDILSDKTVQSEVMSDVSAFTLTEIESIPFRFLVLFKIGLFGFKTYVLVTTGSFLCSLPLAKRRNIVDSWAFGKVALTRKFMKLIRSLTLLAYYEHPRIREKFNDY
ncbi:MAG: flippase-like domain-containing protein [Candidatus Melainabacteria bacterium]|nr:MAG: flippase-like domain-containing protein [Candidatus Melainabacteria bacterium]